MPNYLNYNGDLFSTHQPIITADNRGLRYGDGIFETMKIVDGDIRLAAFHFERLFNGASLLKFTLPHQYTSSLFKEQISELCSANNHPKQARVRMMLLRKSGGLYDAVDHTPDYIIQSWELPPATGKAHRGLVIDVYPDARKPVDVFANLKSNNYLPYLMGALYAVEQKLDDCLILNSTGNISDTTIANIFIIKNNIIYTPPLSEGCVAGVMRRYLLNQLPIIGFIAEEKPLSMNDILQADEVFLSNSIHGVRLVSRCRGIVYDHALTSRIIGLLPENPY